MNGWKVQSESYIHQVFRREHRFAKIFSDWLFTKFREIVELLFHQLNPKKARKFSLFTTLLYAFKNQVNIEHNKIKEGGVEVT